MKQLSSAEFDDEVLRSKEPVLVDFYAQDCPPCRMMAPVLQEIEGQIKVVKVDAANELDLAASYGVRAVPAFFAFVDGKCVGQTVGAKSKANMKEWFEESVQAAA